MWRTGLIGGLLLIAAGTGCRSSSSSCSNQNSFWDRLTGSGKSSAAPARTASNTDPGCPTGCGTIGQPVSYGMATPVPAGGFMAPTYPEGTPFPITPTAPGRSDELPLPANIPPTNLPATPSPAIPSTGGIGSTPARVTAEPRGK